MILGGHGRPPLRGGQKRAIFAPLRCKVQGGWGGSAHYPDPTAQSASRRAGSSDRARTAPADVVAPGARDRPPPSAVLGGPSGADGCLEGSGGPGEVGSGVSGRGRAAVAHGRSRGRAQSHGLATPKGGCPPGPEVALWAGANARQCPGIADRHSTPQDVALATSCSVPMSASPALRFRSEP